MSPSPAVRTKNVTRYPAPAAPSFLARHMQIHRLDADATGPGEAVDDEVHVGAEEAARKPVDLGFHRHRDILEQPPARLDVDRLARREGLLEHVAVAVQPD